MTSSSELCACRGIDWNLAKDSHEKESEMGRVGEQRIRDTRQIQILARNREQATEMTESTEIQTSDDWNDLRPDMEPPTQVIAKSLVLLP